LYVGRTLVVLLPLLGIFGTVWGLIDTISYLGSADLSDPSAMPAILDRFATALNTTFWGVLGAVINIALYEPAIASLEAIDDEG